MPNASKTLRGKCHCGNIAFDLIWTADGDIPARACDCTFCSKHAGVCEQTQLLEQSLCMLTQSHTWSPAPGRFIP